MIPIIVYNSLGMNRRSVVRAIVSQSDLLLLDAYDEQVPFQLNPLFLRRDFEERSQE